MKTRAEIRAFLDAQVGTIPQHPHPYGNGDKVNLCGQCVTGIKVLLDFLGVPNPYAARGDAIIVDDTLLRQGIADNGKGWLTIVVNKDMGYIEGVHYGHIWIDLQGEANYESNGNRALHFTKNTRPISQGQQFVNLDKWIAPEGGTETMNDNAKKGVYRIALHREPENDQVWRGVSSNPEQALANVGGSPEWLWQNHVLKVAYPQAVADLTTANNRMTALTDQLTKLQNEDVIDKQQLADLTSKIQKAQELQDEAQQKAKDALDKYTELQKQGEADQATGNSFLRWLGNQLNKLTGGK